MATRAEEPQPCDMESPIRSLGFHSSQVKVPPAATMWAQPGNRGVGERVHHGLGQVRCREGTHELEPVIGSEVDAEARHVRADFRHVGRRHHAVGERQRVGLLRGAAALGAVGVDAVHVDAVGASEGRVDRGRQLDGPRPLGVRARRIAGQAGQLRHAVERVDRQHVARRVRCHREVVAVDGITVARCRPTRRGARCRPGAPTRASPWPW